MVTDPVGSILIFPDPDPIINLIRILIWNKSTIPYCNHGYVVIFLDIVKEQVSEQGSCNSRALQVQISVWKVTSDHGKLSITVMKSLEKVCNWFWKLLKMVLRKALCSSLKGPDFFFKGQTQEKLNFDDVLRIFIIFSHPVNCTRILVSAHPSSWSKNICGLLM